MSNKRDYYEVLEVERGVTAGDLKKAYRRLAMKYHPDQNPDDPSAEGRFKEITEAFQVLSDANKRAHYDRFGHDPPAGTGGFGGGFDMDMGNMTDFFESVFGSVFGGGQGRGSRRRGNPGRDLQYDLSLTLEQAVSGADVEIRIPRPVRCTSCGGTGAKDGAQPKTCAKCQGRGQLRVQQGIFAMSAPCAMCQGRGEVIEQICEDCHGGLVVVEEDFNVSLPPGVSDGAVKVVGGSGEQGRGGAPDGDLHVMIHLAKHDIFVRRGDDLHCEIKVSYPQAVLGDEITVPTIYGEAKMKIKPGTSSGRVYRLRAKGVPHLRGAGSGDQHVHVEVDIPKNLTSRQRQLIEELGKELGDEIKTQEPSFVDRVKSFFE